MPARDPQERLIILRQRTVEMFGLPGDACRHAVCRRSARCRSVTPAGPDCLAQLGADEKAFFKRILTVAAGFDGAPSALTTCYVQYADDPFLMLVADIVRRAQPRGHWLHQALPFWYAYTTGKRGRPALSLTAAIAAPRRSY
ncbi:hypothetical protein [Pararhizobium antarcticum]|uniref:Uncharacterized protein n=1 Tax=Pararhizobium antarcticum TaxID=1798805 RepID=A0A657LKY6_9HYPH|nr:hypothetical protein [Pararhizobium antarcticum]OJF90731.1 hypothetical protein AX760_24050 [Pararhizobium antarcticum]OJF91167.1 hypothetical protein AX761_22610 [Rhizobium sp. 58]